jgi:hypothetical protein
MPLLDAAPHPRDKEPVGARLNRIALVRARGRKLAGTSVRDEGSKIVVRFHACCIRKVPTCWMWQAGTQRRSEPTTTIP